LTFRIFTRINAHIVLVSINVNYYYIDINCILINNNKFLILDKSHARSAKTL